MRARWKCNEGKFGKALDWGPEHGSHDREVVRSETVKSSLYVCLFFGTFLIECIIFLWILYNPISLLDTKKDRHRRRSALWVLLFFSNAILILFSMDISNLKTNGIWPIWEYLDGFLPSKISKDKIDPTNIIYTSTKWQYNILYWYWMAIHKDRKQISICSFCFKVWA